MKVLKTIILVIAIILGGFALIGIIKPSVEYGVSVEVSKSPDQAWNVYTNPDLFDQWLEGFKSITVVEDVEGIVGSVYEVEVDANGNQAVFTEKVTAFDENELFGMHISNEDINTDISVSFEATESGGTKITSHGVAKGTTWFMKSMFALMGSAFQEQEQKNYDALAALIERTEMEPDELEIEPIEEVADSLQTDSL